MSRTKACINVVVIGHVNSGKATSIGHLIYKCSPTGEETFEKLGKESTETDKERFKYTLLLEKLKAEHEYGDPIDLSLWTFETKKNYIRIIDVPGHCNFVKNMITGSSRADCAVLMVSASDGEFEVGFSKNGQTRKHIQLAYTLGIQQIIVAINKMDTTEPPYSEERFEQIRIHISNYLNEIEYHPTTTVFVPVSGWYGDNLVEVSKNMAWFRASSMKREKESIIGKTILEVCDLIVPAGQPTKKPLRVPIQDVYKIGGIGTVPVGRVASGILKPDMIINFAPTNLLSKVKSLETGGTFHEALPGDNIGFNVEGVTIEQLKRGFVCSDAKNDPAGEVISFTAYLIVLNHSRQICQGYRPMLCCHTARVACEFVELIKKLDRRLGKTLEHSPKYLKSKEAAIVKIIPLSPMCVEKFADYPLLGRFKICDMEQTIAVGIIKNIEKKAPTILHQARATNRRIK